MCTVCLVLLVLLVVSSFQVVFIDSVCFRCLLLFYFFVVSIVLNMFSVVFVCLLVVFGCLKMFQTVFGCFTFFWLVLALSCLGCRGC